MSSLICNAWYNDPSRIKIESLKDLIDLYQERKTAKQKGDNLSSLMVLGKFILDTYGQVGEIQKNRLDIYPADIPNFPQVLFYDDYWNFVKSLNLFQNKEPYLTISLGYQLPGLKEVCPICASGWYLESCDDIQYINNIEKNVHRSCKIKQTNTKVKHDLTSMLIESGLHIKSIKEIPNEYNSENYNGNWYIFNTDLGDFKVGWRKRVISISWDFTNIPTDIFVDFDTTIDSKYIHAWGYKQGTEIFKRIKLYLNRK